MNLRGKLLLAIAVVALAWWACGHPWHAALGSSRKLIFSENYRSVLAAQRHEGSDRTHRQRRHVSGDRSAEVGAGQARPIASGSKPNSSRRRQHHRARRAGSGRHLRTLWGAYQKQLDESWQRSRD